jgi:hypothetical protein
MIAPNAVPLAGNLPELLHGRPVAGQATALTLDDDG